MWLPFVPSAHTRQIPFPFSVVEELVALSCPFADVSTFAAVVVELDDAEAFSLVSLLPDGFSTVFSVRRPFPVPTGCGVLQVRGSMANYFTLSL